MNAVELLRMQMREAHETLEATVGELTPEQLHFAPPGRALPVGAAYAHVIFSEDILVQYARGEKPLFEAGAKTGASEPHPNFMAEGADWSVYPGWTQRVRFDLGELRAYARQVYANTDAYLESLTEDDLDKPEPFLQQTVAHFIARALVAHVDNLTGEVSAVKGVQGLQGYPF
jgi:hypothetical protein